MADHLSTLRADGFKFLTRRRVALAHFLWFVELEVEQERALRLVEETILRLISTGVDDPDRIAELMGLDESNIVPEAIADLLRKNAVRHDQGVLQVSAGGTAVLSNMALRETARIEERLRHDPYRDRIVLVGAEREHLSDTERRAAGLQGVPVPRELTRIELQNRHLQLQALLDERAKLTTGAVASRVALLRVLPRGTPHFVWEEADLEVWRHATDDSRWEWRLLVDDVEDEFVRGRLRELEDDGADVIPLDEAPSNAESSALDRALSDLFERASPVADGLGARDAAVNGAREITFVGPAGATGGADVHVLLAIADRLDADIERVQIATTRNVGKRSPMADPMLAAVERIRAEAASKIVVGDAPSPLVHGLLAIDGERAYVTRYLFAPYSRRPGKGIWWPEVRSVSSEAFRAVSPRIDALFMVRP